MREETRQLRAPAAWLLAAAVVSRGAGLGAGVLLARILGPEQFGTFVLVQSAAAFFAGLAGLGVGLALTRQLAAIGANVTAGARYLSTAIGATLAGSVLVTAIFLAGSGPLATQVLHLPGNELLLAAAGGVFFAALAGTFQGGLLGFEAFPQMAGSQILQGLALAGGAVVGALVGGTGWALAGSSLGYAAAAVGSLALLGRVAARRAIVIHARPHGPTWQRLWPLAAPALCASVVVFAALLVCQVVLSRQSGGEAELASFNLAYRSSCPS